MQLTRIGVSGLIIILCISSAMAQMSSLGLPPWPMLGHEARHTGRSYATGPDDPTVLGNPWPYGTGGPIASSPAIDFTGIAYVGSDDGALHAVRQDGTGHPLLYTGGPVRSSPALIADERQGPAVVYFASDDGKVYSILPNGTIKWVLV
jgi:outer membrane protein assembly factor BamB